MGRRCHAIVVRVLIAISCVPFAASAQVPVGKSPPRDPAAAEALFEQGRLALEKNDLESACAKFAESQRLDPGVGTLLNLANCQERQGRVASAWQHWREALRQLPEDDDRTAFARQHVAALEPKLPRLNITLSRQAPADTRVWRDGVALGHASLGTPLPVDPGVRSISASAPGFASKSFEILVAEGQSRSIEVFPGESLRPAPRRSAARETSSRSTVGWALIGAGTAGALTAIVTGLMLPDRQETVDANCTADGCNQAGLDAASEGKTLLILNTVGWGVGIAGLGAGAFLVLSQPAAPIQAMARSRAPSLGVVASPRGFGLAYGSGF
jgi:tetratricopeptide (TPR) repeat protein